MVTLNPISIAARHRIVEFAARNRLAAIYGDALFVEDGGLMFYGAPPPTRAARRPRATLDADERRSITR